MDSTILYLILIILTVSFLFENWLEYLNIKHLEPSLPKILHTFYDADKYRKSVDYEKVNTQFSFFNSSLSFVLVMLMLLLSGFGVLNHWIVTITTNVYIQSLLFVGILFFVSDILNTPFQYYHTFVIEERFGFNRSTRSTFILDKLKGWLMTIILGGGILLFLLWTYQSTGAWFFLLFMAGITLFSLTMTLFYSKLIVPLFNKLTPLPQGELLDAINNFAKKHQFSVKDVSVIDGSKRSTKANAYFSGFGPRKRIVLYDTLIKELSVKEIVAVLAHEAGHSKNNHVLKGMMLSLANIGLMVALLAWALDLPKLSFALGAKEPAIYLNILAFGLLYTPISEITGLFSHLLSRKYEYQADHFVTESGFGEPLISALIKLSVTSLSNLTPHPYYVFWHYSHPTLLQRIGAIRTSTDKI